MGRKTYDELLIQVSELEEQNRKLIKSKEDIEVLIEFTQDRVLICDKRGIPVYFNSEYKSFLKDAFNFDVKHGCMLLKQLNNNKISGYWEDLHIRAGNGEKFRDEFTLDFSEGDVRYYEISVNPIMYNADVNGFVEIVRDITACRKALNKKVNTQLPVVNENVQMDQYEQDERFRDIFVHANDAITYLDKKGYIRDINPVGVKLYGGIKEELIGKHFKDIGLLTAKDLGKYLKLFRDYLSGRKLNIELTLTNKTGQTIHLDSTASIIKKNGKTDGLLVITRDVTDRKTSEEAVRKSEEKYRTLFNQSTEGIYLHDLTGKILDVNNVACSQSGYSREELQDLSILDLFPDIINKEKIKKHEITDLWNSWIPGQRYRYEVEHQRNDGLKISLDLTTGIVNYGGENQILAIAKDVTEEKHLQEQLEIRQRMDSLGTLAGGIAHDFNNILVGIMGNINFLNLYNDNFSEEQKEILESADQSCERAAELIKQFQSLSIGAIRERKEIDLHDIADEVFDIIKISSSKLISKQIRFSKGEILLNADSREIHQVLLNLATNSVQAIDSRGAESGDFVRIRAQDYKVLQGDRTGLPEGNYIHISFKDSGIGMAPDVIKKVFDPMFTTRDIGSRKGQGLGLSIVYNIVTRIYKGHIWINSEVGKGTTAHVYFPSAASIQETEAKTTGEISGGTETILIIDDEQTILKLTAKILSKIGYTVLCAGSGQEAIKIYKRNKNMISAVILDVSMPLMSGQHVFQELLNLNPDVKVIISTGLDEDYSATTVFGNAKGNIYKPYKIEEFTQTVREVLDL